MTDDAEPTEEKDETLPVERLAAAIQEFVTSLHDEAVMVTGSVVTWESTAYHDDGTIGRRVSYSCPTESTSMAQALGLTVSGQRQIERDLGLHDRDQDDDED